jgi:hypothetical protein
MVKKSIIIDFDHTIGYFEQIIFLINIVETIYQEALNAAKMYLLFTCYPHVFRPKLYDIIQLILYFQKDDNVTFFILYTCNNKPHFVEAIVSFLEGELHHSPLFQYILYEKSKHKNMNTILQNIQEDQMDSHLLCFIDNKLFHYTNQTDIKYIKCEDYIYHYDIKEIVKLFPYDMFEEVNKSTLIQYFKLKPKSKKKTKHKRQKGLPYSLYEMNSSFILQSLRDFVLSAPVI